MNNGKTETGYNIPEKIESIKFIMKLIGSACLKYKTKDRLKNDNAIKGIIIANKSINEIIKDIGKKLYLPIICKKYIKMNFRMLLIKGYIDVQKNKYIGLMRDMNNIST